MNLSNELGISKNRKIEILTEMGYKHLWNNSETEFAWHYPKKPGTGHWIKVHELESLFHSDDSFKEFVKYKLNK